MSAFAVPDDIAAALTDNDWLNQVYDALGPPRDVRVDERFDIEVEVRGGQTYCIRYKGGALQGKKGFARGEPFIAVSLDDKGWALAQKVLRAAAAGFPDAPLAQRQLDKLRGLDAGALRDLYVALAGLQDAALAGQVGDVAVTCARGPIESATRTVTVTLPAGAVDDMLRGQGRPQDAQLGGDGRLKTEAAAAFSPFVARAG